MQQPKLTFIHGFMGGPSDWDEVRAALPEFETAAVEVRPAADWQSSVTRLSELISPGSIVVGYSMGARLALGVALADPPRCKGLVFVSGNPGLNSDQDRDERWLSDQRLAERIEAGSLETFLADWYQAGVFAGLPEEIRRAEIQRKLARRSSDWSAILRCNSVSKQPNYWPRLSDLKIPALVVAGERDEKYKKIATGMSEDVPVTIVPNAGHIVHREQPDDFVQIIREFARTEVA